jgi:hypothetical protein
MSDHIFGETSHSAIVFPPWKTFFPDYGGSDKTGKRNSVPGKAVENLWVFEETNGHRVHAMMVNPSSDNLSPGRSDPLTAKPARA